MIDIEKQVKYWSEGAGEDIDTARVLMESSKVLPALFFAHLGVEKMLKGVFCRVYGELAPRIHDLPRLCELAGLTPDDRQMVLMSILTRYNLEGRYPVEYPAQPPYRTAMDYLAQVEELLVWLKKKL